MRYHLLSLEDREDLGERSRPRRKKHDYRIALFGGSQPQSCRYFNPKVFLWSLLLLSVVMLLLLLRTFISAHKGLQLDRHSLPIREAPRCHSCLLGQCRLHPRWLTALPHQAHGLLQRLKGQLVLQTGSTHASRQLSSLRCSGKDLHIWGLRSR